MGGGRDVRSWGEGSRSGGGGVGWVCEKVIKTFHDIRVCEVPRADH